MLTKGFIVEPKDNLYKVRIPQYHGMEGGANFTADKDLPYAQVSSSLDIKKPFKKGTVVFIDFEKNNLSTPVILGVLLLEDGLNLENVVKAQTLVVDGNATLPKSTTIGDVDNIKIGYLKNLRSDIQGQIDDVEDNILNQPLRNMVFTAQSLGVGDIFFGDEYNGINPKEYLNLVPQVTGIGYKFLHVSYSIIFNYQDVQDEHAPLLYLTLNDPLTGDEIHKFFLNKGEENRIDFEIQDLGDFYDFDNSAPYYVKMKVNDSDTIVFNGEWETSDQYFEHRLIGHNIEFYPFNIDPQYRYNNEITDVRVTNVRMY